MRDNIIRDLRDQIIQYLIVNNEFFEKIGEYDNPDSEILLILKKILPNNWQIVKKDIWYMCFPLKNEPIPPQGWKIHISSVSWKAEETLLKILPILIENNLPFKVVIDKYILSFINSKNFERGSSGKFITIYPNTLSQFLKAIEECYKATKLCEGPYILSDKPYKDSKVVFYRYGGVHPKYILNIYGEHIPVIFSPDGTPIPDVRTPFPNFPDWVRDPFEKHVKKENEETEEIVLNKKYKIKQALFFSNSGGVYEAEKINSSQKVIIKEARPWIEIGVNSFLNKITATEILKKEYEILKKLSSTGYVPLPIEFFKEWEHLFLVEEYFEGIPLTSFRAQPDFVLILKKKVTQREIKKFCEKLYIIFSQIVEAVNLFHKHNILLNDISPSNILIDPKTLKIKFIDFETALEIKENNHTDILRMYTPGFAPIQRLKEGKTFFEDDYYSIGALLYNMIMPMPPIFQFTPRQKFILLEEIFRDFGLPFSLKKLIFQLLEEDRKKRINLSKLSKNEFKNFFIPPKFPKKFTKPVRIKELKKELSKVLKEMVKYILNNMTLHRKDRLFPADYRVFQTNPLNLAYGAIGVSFFVYKYLKYLPREIENWIFSHKISVEEYPPGFYVGLAGIAYALNEMGYKEKALNIMDILYKSPLLYEAPDIFYGIAGWGMASLYFYKETKNNKYLEKAIEGGEYLIKNAQKNEKGMFWENSDGKVYFGFAHGQSGIAYFLLSLYLVTEIKKFFDCAMKAINFELIHCQHIEDYLTLPRSLSPSEFTMPYWQYGSSGLGMILIRTSKIFRIPLYEYLADKIAKDASGKYAAAPWQFRGLSGLGEFLIDMYQFTKNSKYLREAYKIAKGCLLFQIKTEKGIAFPGEEGMRISTDYGLGSAGVGMFFHRLINLEQRAFMIDELFFEKLKI
jgi:serine/threonine protein kinase